MNSSLVLSDLFDIKNQRVRFNKKKIEHDQLLAMYIIDTSYSIENVWLLVKRLT